MRDNKSHKTQECLTSLRSFRVVHMRVVRFIEVLSNTDDSLRFDTLIIDMLGTCTLLKYSFYPGVCK